MPLALDHAFIMCSIGAPEGDALIQRGFVEGSGNVHPGQGTANRRFFFENFMLELVWVDKPEEARSAQTRRTRLWERWVGREDRTTSPFGVLFCAEGESAESAPFQTWSYQPSYLPAGDAIEIAEGTRLEEPELFYMPGIRRDRPRRKEPTNHAVGIGPILGLTVGLPEVQKLSDTSRSAQDAGLLSYMESDRPVLEIRFASATSADIDLRPALPLLFRGPSSSRAHQREHESRR
jgi:Glyoxalase-like domain